MTIDDLLTIGFTRGSDGVLRADSRVTLTPIDGHYYHLIIALPQGTLSCVVPKIAIKEVQHTA